MPVVWLRPFLSAQEHQGQGVGKPRPAGDIGVLTQDETLHRHKRLTLTVGVCLGGLTGGPGGPGGPLLSWVQVQALGMAGQSASFLWRRKQS